MKTSKMKFNIGQKVWVLKEKICQGDYAVKVISATIGEYLAEGNIYRVDGYYPYCKVLPSFAFKTEDEIFALKEEAMSRLAFMKGE